MKSSHSLSLLSLALFAHLPAFADIPQRYDIPPQPLHKALTHFADRNNLKLLYDTQLTQGMKTQGASGAMNRDAALRTLLAGTGLNYRYTDAGAVTLAKTETHQTVATKTEATTPTLPTVTVVGNQADSLEEERKRYSVRSSSTAMKTDTPLLETPVAIQIVPRAVLDDQQVITLKEAVQNVSGVQWSPVEGNLYENFVIRGFDGNNALLRNGIRETAWAAETANIDRVEVLKGTAAGLYGRTDPGGLINRVTKQPLFTPYYSVQQQVGSFDNFRSTVDATGPINEQLAYRMNLAYQSSQSFRDFVNNERVFLAPSLTWRISDRTEAGLTLEYQYDRLRWDDGIPAIGNRPAPLPINAYVAYPNSKDSQERELVDFHWSHAFNDDWKLEQRFVASLANYRQQNLFGWGLDTTDNRTQFMSYWDAKTDRDTYSQNLNLTGHVDTWGAKHTLLVGFDFFLFDQIGATASTFGPIANLDIYRRDYSQASGFNLNVPLDSIYAHNEQWYGLYFQDQIKLWDKLNILIGGRHDWADYAAHGGGHSVADAEALAAKNRVHAEKFQPRLGINYQFMEGLAAYGSYTESLGSNNGGRDLNNQVLKPQEAQGFEAGLKGEFLEGRLTASLAYFNILKNNIAAGSPNPILAQQGVMATVGGARNQGIEFDISGQLSENWFLIANYAWTNSRITKDGSQTVWNSDYSSSTYLPNGFLGYRLPLVPRHSANIWLKYEFTDPLLKGLSLGTGMRIASQVEGDPANDYQLPGYAVWKCDGGL